MTRLVVKKAEEAHGTGARQVQSQHNAPGGSVVRCPAHATQSCDLMHAAGGYMAETGFSSSALHGSAARLDNSVYIRTCSRACDNSAHTYDSYSKCRSDRSSVSQASAGAGGINSASAHYNRSQKSSNHHDKTLYYPDAGLDVSEAGAACCSYHHDPDRVKDVKDTWGDECNKSGDDDNSADEADSRTARSFGAAGKVREESMDEDELEQILCKEKGFRVNRMLEDGNCLFRAIADQIYGDPEMHHQVRKLCMDYLLAERDHFSQFVTQDFDTYVKRKRNDKTFGNNLEMQAMAEMFNRPIEVYCNSVYPMKIFHEGYTQASHSTPLRLSYHRGNHYNSVINPMEHTIGEGLGLPSAPVPSSREEKINEEFEKVALLESEQDLVEEAILESILRASRETWEQTQFQSQIEQMSIRESSQEYYNALNPAYFSSGASGDVCAAGGRSLS